MAFPDFLLIGAMKCGTSTLQAQLARQPGIFMSTPKEPNFFSDNAVYAKGLAWYESLFENAAPGDLRGEASTHYTKLPTFPETLSRLREALDSPKLIYLIRNPVERAVSHFVHEWTMGKMPADIEAAFERHPELIDYGRYAYQIEPYLQTFGRDTLMLCTLEEMSLAPEAFLEKVGAFLGVQSRLCWHYEHSQVNVSAERIRRLPLHGLLVDNPLSTALRRTLVPKSVRDRIRRSRQMAIEPLISPERRQYLETVFAEDHSRLVTIFPDCAEIAGAYAFLYR